MKKIVVLGVATTLLLSSCDTYMRHTYAGASLGGVLGSAVGGIAGGARGSDIGTIIGMVGGAAVGSAIDANEQKKTEEAVREHYERVQRNKARGHNPYRQQDFEAQTGAESGFDGTNSGDDRLYDLQMGAGDYPTEMEANPIEFTNEANVERLTQITKEMPNIEVGNLVFTDNNGNNILSRGEVGQIAFEIHNRGTQPISNLYPTITEATNSNRFRISPTTRIDVLMPGETVRYTATIVADRKVKTGEYSFAIAILKDNRSIARVTELRLKTQK